VTRIKIEVECRLESISSFCGKALGVEGAWQLLEMRGCEGKATTHIFGRSPHSVTSEASNSRVRARSAEIVDCRERKAGPTNQTVPASTTLPHPLKEPLASPFMSWRLLDLASARQLSAIIAFVWLATIDIVASAEQRC
jgi:hypothetical protein